MVGALAIMGSLAVILALGLLVFLNQDKFGAVPSGARLERVLASPNYRDGKFQNLIPTAVSGGNGNAGFFYGLKTIIFPRPRQTPSAPLPSVKNTDLKNLPDGSLVWFGHSAFLIKLKGKTFLFDPTLSQSASPVSFTTKAFLGTHGYKVEDLPKIDYLFFSHDHWDHLDYPTVMALKNDSTKIICPLGVGAHFDKWGFDEALIFEGDWWDVFEPAEDLKITFVPARHFSGRGLTWNQSLWTGFLLEFDGKKIFYTGDGGYLPQYKEFGQKLGPVDLALVECGQYDPGWKLIHMTPEESVQSALDMLAGAAMPVHSGKFKIARHAWDDPFVRFKAASLKSNLKTVSPMIGEIVKLDELASQKFQDWWVGVD
ncbi:MAG: MBL fold metallo-hydrolase [Deltaproteobacteria bacterium]|jgi:L-ascorbate metabolism protein UlaG (beta-lactamase superfamily)|nr:MBL fold metallo-hydrolase [Deltaproteobacteria bacterium]